MHTRTKFVILMHPYEHRRIKLNTGRLTHHCLANSELYVDETFDRNDGVQTLISDPDNYPVLLYPGEDAFDLSKGELEPAAISNRQLVVFLIDATWRLARPMLRFSESLKALPKVMFSGAEPSRYVIKKQPEPGCLSTLEAVHELLLALERSGLDEYPMPEQMLEHFMKMQAYQLKRTEANRMLGFATRDTREASRAQVGKKSTNPSKRRPVFPRSR